MILISRVTNDSHCSHRIDPNSAQDILSRLQRVSYDVVATMVTVDEVITRANQLKPDLILMDIRMNDERGSIVAAREIKRRHNIPIVFIAPDADVATIRQALRPNPTAFLSSPWTSGNSSPPCR